MSPHDRAMFRELKILAKSCTETPDQEQGQAHTWVPSMRLSLLLESTERGDASSTARTTLVGCSASTFLRTSFMLKYCSASPMSLTARVALVQRGSGRSSL